jgi:enoyl-CoA hydratase
MGDEHSGRVTYRMDGSIATITMDDGKVNVLSPAMQADINAAIDQAENDGATVILTGRPGRFSAGFDLNTLTAGGSEAVGMLRGGFELASRLLGFPRPVVIACSGHAMAMGFFLLLSGDYTIGVDGPYKLVANEVAIGLPMPRPAIAVMRNRLTPAAFTRTAVLAQTFSPEDAIAAGVLDRLVAERELLPTALEVATALSALDMNAHAITKRLARASTLEAIAEGIEVEYPNRD